MAAFNFPDSPVIGQTTTNSASGVTYKWNGTYWESVGTPLTLRQNITKFSANGTNGNLVIADNKLYVAKGNNTLISPLVVPMGSNVASNTVYGFDNMFEITIPGESGSIVDADVYGSSAYCLFANGNLYTWGENSQGQLGLGDTTVRYLPVVSNTNVVEVYTNFSNSQRTIAATRLFIKKTDGRIYGCGDNSNGALGIGTTTDQTSWVLIPNIAANPKSVWNMGDDLGCLVVQQANNEIWLAGSNAFGQLGSGNTTTITTLTNYSTAWNAGTSSMIIQEVGGGFGWSDASNNPQVNAWLSMFLSDGTNTIIRTCGDNSNGQLALPTTTSSRSTPVTSITGSVSNPITQMSTISSGTGTCLALFTNGELRGWGRNNEGQLGLGNFTTAITASSLCNTGVTELPLPYHSFYRTPYETGNYIKKSDGYYYATGYNLEGQLGTGATLARFNTWQRMILPKDLNFKYVGRINAHPNAYSVVGITDDNKLYGWGYSTYGQLISSQAGITNPNNINIPVQLNSPVLYNF
jgi:alpha-tubulin suppressor-like RCC1 family protein